MSIGEMKKNNAPLEKDVTLYLSDFWRGFVKFWWVGIVLGLVFGVVALYIGYVTFIPEYEVSATFTVHTENNTLADDAYAYYYNRSTANELATVFPHVFQSRLLSNRVCKDLGIEAMPAEVSAKCVSGTNMITLTTTGKDPQVAYDVLLSVIDNYSYITEYIIGPTRLVSLSPPEVPSEPSNELVWYTVVLNGMLVGLAIGAAWIALYAVLRQTVRTKEDIHQTLNQTCIGVVPEVTFKRYSHKGNNDILLTNPLLGHEFLESYRLLRDAVQNNLQENEKVLLLTSTTQGEGKSVTTVNLAAMFAKNLGKVLVIDGDLRNSGISKLISRNFTDDIEGLQTFDPEGVCRIDRVEQLGVDVLSFRANARQLWKIIRTNKLKEIIDPLRSKYDLILIDTPPCGLISDAAIFAGAADVAFYIVRQDAVMGSRIREGINTLLATEIRFAGCILNGAAGGLGGYGGNYGYGGYRSYYSYGYSGKYAGRYKAKKLPKKRS